MNKDPIGLAGGINLYGYAQANPIKYVDPSGLFKIDWNCILRTLEKHGDAVVKIGAEIISQIISAITGAQTVDTGLPDVIQGAVNLIRDLKKCITDDEDDDEGDGGCNNGTTYPIVPYEGPYPIVPYGGPFPVGSVL